MSFGRSAVVVMAGMLLLTAFSSEGRVLHEELQDNNDFSVDSLVELAVDAVLEHQSSLTSDTAAPTRRALIEVALARAARERAQRDAVLAYNEERRQKNQAISNLRNANRVAKSSQDYDRSQINKLEAQKRELERENRSLRSACLKSTH